MLDIGTGVLAIVAARMGLSNILALDLDPVAVDNAKSLAALNGTPAIDFRVMDAAHLPLMGTYELIAAKLIQPGSPVIVSGIGNASREEMEELMTDSGFTEIKKVSSGW